MSFTARVGRFAAVITLAATLQPATARVPAVASGAEFTVVRVTVSATGRVETLRVAYQSGDRDFNDAAVRAVRKTQFIPNAGTAAPSTFDYVLAARADGTHVTRIMGHLRGDRSVSAVASVHVAPHGDAWLASAAPKSRISAR